jgi:hypothetical protein
MSDAMSDAISDAADAACHPTISVASFDQSCTQDSDCVRVIVGDSLHWPCDRPKPAMGGEDCSFVCGLSFAAINVSADQEYNAAFSQLSPLTPPPLCSCPDASTFKAEAPVCCLAGQCHADPACLAD